MPGSKWPLWVLGMWSGSLSKAAWPYLRLLLFWGQPHASSLLAPAAHRLPLFIFQHSLLAREDELKHNRLCWWKWFACITLRPFSIFPVSWFDDSSNTVLYLKFPRPVFLLTKIISSVGSYRFKAVLGYNLSPATLSSWLGRLHKADIIKQASTCKYIHNANSLRNFKHCTIPTAFLCRNYHGANTYIIHFMSLCTLFSCM